MSGRTHGLDPFTSTVEKTVVQIANRLPIASERLRAIVESIVQERPNHCVEVDLEGCHSFLARAMTCQAIDHGRVTRIASWSTIGKSTEWQNIHEFVTRQKLERYCEQLCGQPAVMNEYFPSIDHLHIGVANRDVLTQLTPLIERVKTGGQLWIESDSSTVDDLLATLSDQFVFITKSESLLRLRKRPTQPVRKRRERQLMTFPAGALGRYRGGTYNPGGLLHNNHLIALLRNEVFTELERLDSPHKRWGTCRPLLVYLDRDNGRVISFTPLTLPSHLQSNRAEDFRLFVWKSRLFTSFSHVRREGHTSVEVAEFDLQALEFKGSRSPRLDLATLPVEKNWCFFAHQDKLFMLYSFQPYRLLSMVCQKTFRFETVLDCRIRFFDRTHALSTAQRVSLSSPPFRLGDDLILFVHLRRDDQIYEQYAVWLDPQTLHPIQVSSDPIFRGGDAAGMRPNVLYLMSVAQDTDDFWFFFGEGDEHASTAHYSAEQLRELLAERMRIELDRVSSSHIGDYALQRDGQDMGIIRLDQNGVVLGMDGDHPYRWEVHQSSNRLELWILGRKGIVCRMTESKTQGGWQGIWNRGNRCELRLQSI